ncbi:AraC family transcriptional regulator [Saccharophagus sp. K07]|uniref:helix-turn-helix domain-containing protein n=1 Tax=Saccharophagus sp. K07 TaxID=2283636 RepID=UPI001652717A|nr:helix-turn-helix domain-containing protein [Saccharophagus sp. K07]MBC6904080.1 AraC family transcriptional regulator [Saccharophagus sp. K07]
MYETPRFYRSAAILFASLVITTILAGYISFEQTFLVDRLLPASKSVLPWEIQASSDSEQDGESTIQVHDAVQTLDYSFTLSDKAAYSYATLALYFNPQDTATEFANLAKYPLLRFSVKCNPANTLSFTAVTRDSAFADENHPKAFRIPTAFFSCNEQWETVEIDLRHLEIPEWWLNYHGVSLSDRGYQLSQVANLSFGVSIQSPRHTPSSVKIADVELIGRDWRSLYFFAAFSGIIWLTFGFWFFKVHMKILIATLEEQIQKDRPLIAYQQLSVEPHRDKEKSAVLRYMATEYANPDISLETAISALGINRTKMNSILKDEIGLTFSAYLNKLRLTEAARLLSEKPEANVAEIAFSVGYNNVSYFNKLFKNEYGCSPKMFKSIYSQKGETAGADNENVTQS